MTVHWKKSVFRSFGAALLLASGALGAKCDGLDSQTFTLSDTACTAGTAQILVMDGMMKRLCGCLSEAGDTLIRPPGTLACTVASGSRVFFHFSGAKQRHQIIPVGSPGFPSSPMYDPNDATSASHVVTFTGASATTFFFKDQYDSALTGQVVIQ